MATPSNHIDTLANSTKNFYHILILTLLAALIYTASVYKNGSGLTDDSINYLHAASSFIKEFKLLKVDNTPFTEWPPLYPVLLSLAEYTSLSLISFVILLHGILYALNICLALYLLSYFVRNYIIFYVAGITFVFSTPLLLTHVFIWSEPFFITILLLSIVFLYKYLQTEKFKFLIFLITFSVLLYLQRKSGLLFILSHTSILFLLSSFALKKKIKVSLLYLIPTLGIVTAWNIIRFSLAGKIFEEAFWEPLRFGNTWYETLNTISSWLLPDEIPSLLRILTFISAILLVVFYLYFIRKNKTTLLIKLLLLTFFNYLLFLNILLTYVHINDSVDDRILSPVYIPAFIIIFALIQQVTDTLQQKTVKSLAYVLLVLWLSYPISRTSFHIKHWNDAGPGGYNTKAFIDSAFSQYILAIKNTELIYSNNLYQTYYLKLKANNKAEIKDIKTFSEGDKGNSLFICFGTTSCNNILDKDKINIYKDNQGEIFKLK